MQSLAHVFWEYACAICVKGGGGAALPGGVQAACRCGTEEHRSVVTVVMGWTRLS